MGRSGPAIPVAAGGEPERSAPAADERVGLTVPLLAWGLSLLACLLGGDLAHAFGDTPRLLLALLPWVALIGLPRGSGRRREWVVALALALPPLTLAGWLDGRSGLDSAGTAGLAASGLLYFVLLGEAAHRARGPAGGPARGWAHAVAWLALVPGAAALSAALSWGVTGEAADSGLPALLASITPLGALWFDHDPAGLHLASRLFAPATLACLALFTLAALTAQREEAPR